MAFQLQDWENLSFIPTSLLNRIAEFYRVPHVLSSAIDTEDDAADLVRQVATPEEFEAFGDEVVGQSLEPGLQASSVGSCQ